MTDIIKYEFERKSIIDISASASDKSFETSSSTTSNSASKKALESCGSNLLSTLPTAPSAHQNQEIATLYDILKPVRAKARENDKETELTKYLKEPAPENVSVLDYWKNKSNMYPVLSHLAKKYLAIPATSAGVERLFSISGSLARARRARLNAKTLEDVILLRQYRPPIIVSRLVSSRKIKLSSNLKRKRQTIY